MAKAEGFVTLAELEKALKEQEIRFIKMMLAREQVKSRPKKF